MIWYGGALLLREDVPLGGRLPDEHFATRPTLLLRTDAVVHSDRLIEGSTLRRGLRILFDRKERERDPNVAFRGLGIDLKRGSAFLCGSVGECALILALDSCGFLAVRGSILDPVGQEIRTGTAGGT